MSNTILFFKSFIIAITAFLLIPVAGFTADVNPDQNLPRITIKRGQNQIGTFLIKESSEPFSPVGFNHTVLGPPNQHHVVFNVGQYDSKAMNEDLSEMKLNGANTIRLWAWGDTADGTGVTGKADSTGINQEYMENFFDFLLLCRKHQIYVFAVLDEVPLNKGYAAIADREKLTHPCTGVTDYNVQYLSAPFIQAKAALIRDFIGYVKERDSGLLSTVLVWSLCNEAFIYDTYGPFNLKEGLVTTANGKTYDMSDRTQRQACWDEGLVHWANELTRAVKEIDPEALVSAGMFTSDAQDRLPINGLMEPRPDPRYPPRPSVLGSLESQLDFLDIHVYPFHGETTVNLETNEYEEIKRLGTVVLVGEHGIFRHLTPPEKAMEQERELRKNILSIGYTGPLLWIWEWIPGSNTYTAEELGMREKRIKVTE